MNQSAADYSITPISQSSFSYIVQSVRMDLFISELRDVYWTQTHIAALLPQWQNKVNAVPLKEGLQKLVDYSKAHIDRIELLFRLRHTSKSLCHVLEMTVPCDPLPLSVDTLRSSTI